MQDGSNLKAVTNTVLREALARIERCKRSAFPFHGYGNWRDWRNWGNCPYANVWANAGCWANVGGCAWCNQWVNGQ